MKEGLKVIREELGEEAYIIEKTKLGEEDSMLQHFSGNKIKLKVSNEPIKKKPKIRERELSLSCDSTVAATDKNVVSHLYSALDDLKEMVALITGKDHNTTECPEDVFEFGSKDLNNFYRRMIDNEVSEILAGKFIHGLSKKDMDITLEEHLRDSMSSILEFDNIDHNCNIYAFAGEAGCGKTSTIAKLAINLKLKDNLNILNISFDTYKEAGYYQLDSHCKVVSINSTKVHDKDELIKTVEKNRENYDLIFIDTPGFELGEEYAGQFIPSSIKCRKILVLDSNGRYREFKNKVDLFNKAAFDGYAFTKVDETFSYGNIFNILSHNKKPLVCLTHGQEIPGSIINEKEKALDILIKGLC